MSNENEKKQLTKKPGSKKIGEKVSTNKKKSVRKKTVGYPKQLRLSPEVEAKSIRLACRTQPNTASGSEIKRYIGGGINPLVTSHTFSFIAEVVASNNERWGQLEEDNTWVRLVYFLGA